MTRPRQTPGRPRKDAGSLLLLSRFRLGPKENAPIERSSDDPSSTPEENSLVSPPRSLTLPSKLFQAAAPPSTPSTASLTPSPRLPFSRLDFEADAAASPPNSPSLVRAAAAARPATPAGTPPPSDSVAPSPETPPTCTQTGFLSPRRTTTTSFWAFCYGHKTAPVLSSTMTGSAQRAPPKRSCMSTSKKRSRQVAFEPLASQSESFDSACASLSSDNDTVVADATTPQSMTPNRRVQFAPSAAVEFSAHDPPGRLTPVPAAQAAVRFPHLPVQDDDDETRNNSLLLSEWDDASEWFLDDDSDDDDKWNLETPPSLKERRTSHLFTPPAGKSLLQEGDDRDDEFETSSPPDLLNLRDLAAHSPFNRPS